MKVKAITISGMHKVPLKTYELNEGTTYFVGENGAGKSTILEAIQLALLGYIPGYAKTNESIMKHACAPTMSVQAELDSGIKITRTWIRSGSSVKSTEDIVGYDGKIEDLLGQIDLPVFDFNEFRSMTANKLKDWFINFLPESEQSLDIMTELKTSLGLRSFPTADLLAETEEWIKASGLSGLELVRKLNEKFKEDQSFVKGQVSKLQGTIQSLIKYDDIDDINDEEINKKIDEFELLKTQLSRYEASEKMRKSTAEAFEKIKGQMPAERFEDDPRVSELKDKVIEITKHNDVLKADYNDLVSQVRELEQKKAMIPRAGSTCPYTNEPCDTASKLAEKSKSDSEEIDKQIQFKKEEMKECDPSVISNNDRQIMQINAELGAIQSSYDRLVSMQLQLDNIEEVTKPTEMNMMQLDEELKKLREELVKIAANKKYDELSEKVTADKFKLENDLEIYKIWIKLTDANGLQTTLMNKPFENLADDMSSYLSKMFNKPVTAKFNLVSKANSFSFGIDRDSQYIEFDYLSSGERCLFTLALILCILDKSSSEVRTILIDDILDHLDADNARFLFEALKAIPSVQFILAGVKECEEKDICKPV